MRDDEDDESAVIQVALREIEDLLRKAFFGEVEEIDSEKADSEEARGRLFANEESQLVLKDEQSS